MARKFQVGDIVSLMHTSGNRQHLMTVIEVPDEDSPANSVRVVWFDAQNQLETVRLPVESLYFHRPRYEQPT